jgi:hypothetical protein
MRVPEKREGKKSKVYTKNRRDKSMRGLRHVDLRVMRIKRKKTNGTGEKEGKGIFRGREKKTYLLE